MESSVKELLCTIGPSSREPGVLERLGEFGVTMFRINLSHTSLDELPAIIEELRARATVPICLDTEGAQVRTGRLAESAVMLVENAIVSVLAEPTLGTASSFSLYPADTVDRLDVGDLISIDFNAVLVQVIARAPGIARLRVLTGGMMGRNKAVTVHREFPLPALTEKDRRALLIGAEMGVSNIALSFAKGAEDVDEIRDVFGKPAFVISKIESIAGLRNLDPIIGRSDAVLIDRGDLSREVPIERIPAAQKKIIRRAKALDCKVYVATNLLESMIASPQPTRAEVNDVYNTLADGADGLVLAAETAIGGNPLGCAAMIRKLIHEFEHADESLELDNLSKDPISLLAEPHGGKLVRREADEALWRESRTLPQLKVTEFDLMDCEQIALGTYSPLTGFMDKETLIGVLDENRLPNGTIWTLPVILQVPDNTIATIGVGARIALTDEAGLVRSVLDVSECFQIDLEDVAERWFGTTDDIHPGVARLYGKGRTVLAGEVTLVERLPSPYRNYELSPAQLRQIFTHKGWSRVVGFHTRNVCHRVHEHIQLAALQRTYADGLYISPVIGPKKCGDFLPNPIMKSYQLLLDEDDIYPSGKVTLGSFATYSRYAGPREAVFTALCRKNMGCSHFIVGRDHTGVGDFYSVNANQALFDQLGDIGIEPVFFDAIGYDPTKDRYVSLDNPTAVEAISGTQLRQSLVDDTPLPDWFIRPVVQNMLRGELKAGRDIFVQ
jgi:pyruvate kinase